MSIKTVKVHSYEKGLLFKNEEFVGLLEKGNHWFLNPFTNDRVDVVDMRDPWIRHSDLDLIVKSGVLEGKAEVLDLQDFQRALVWINGRFQCILSGGLYALWTTHRKIRVQIIDAKDVLFDHPDISIIMKSESGKAFLQEHSIVEDHVGVYFKNGQYIDTLPAGRYAFWKDIENIHIDQVEMSELTLDISGQEIMTADKVTLRLNAILAYKICDAQKAVRSASDVNQALYREAQLALRAAVGSRLLDDLLADKDALARELEKMIAGRAEGFGLKICLNRCPGYNTAR